MLRVEVAADPERLGTTDRDNHEELGLTPLTRNVFASIIYISS